MKIRDIRTHVIGKYGIANSNRYQIAFVPGANLSKALNLEPIPDPAAVSYTHLTLPTILLV